MAKPELISVLGQFAASLPLWLPSRSAAALFAVAGPFLAVPLGLGLATRLVVALALGAMGYSEMMANDGNFTAFWMLGLALMLVSGPGALSLDGAILRGLKRRFPQLDGKPAFSLAALPRVAIIGAGFGGIACARALRHTPVQVTLLDRHNYHLFQPLLYQVATAALSPGDIASVIRWVLRRQQNVEVLLADVRSIDPIGRTVAVDSGALTIPYDYLVLAPGAAHAYFGHPEWEPRAPGLKTLDDALEMRRRVLLAFEAAEREPDPDRQRRLLTFVIVGGGPTGVELAGALAEIARQSLVKDFRRIRPESARIVLLEGSPHVLGTFPDPLRGAARRALERLGVEVRTDSIVVGI